MNHETKLLEAAQKAIAEQPDNRSEIIDLYRLAISEMEEGESAAHEYELFMDSINELKNMGS